MNKQTATIIIAIIGLLGAAAGGSMVLDLSTTNIGQIGDNIINQYLTDYGINIGEFRDMCDRGEVHEELVKYCGLV